jgi:phage-related holin
LDVKEDMPYKQLLINLQIAASGFAASVMSGLLGYLQVVVLDHINMYAAIVGVVALDTMFGIAKAVKFGKYQTRKATKCVWYILVYAVILTVVNMIEIAHPAAAWLSEAVFLPIILFQFVSALKNASLAGAIPQGLLLKLLESIDKHKDLISSNIQSYGEEVKEAETQNNNPENIEG